MAEVEKLPKTIDVYGTKYKVKVLEKPNKFMYEDGAEGYSDFEKKKIYLLQSDNEKKRTLIHELIHSYLYESGMREAATDETLVEVLTESFVRIEKKLK